LEDPTNRSPKPDRWIAIADLRGDGTRQVLFAASFLKSDGSEHAVDRDELFCFSSDGAILWRYKPNLTVTFGETRFSGPWLICDILAPAAPSSRAVWVALAHDEWRPGAVLTIDGGGTPTLQFLSAGHIYILGEASAGGMHYVLAGGINNEYAAASVAVLRLGAPPSRSPQTADTRFEAVGGPRGDPARYFLFPPTELNAASGVPYNRVAFISMIERGLTVRTQEVGYRGVEPNVLAMYALSPDLEIQDVTFSNSFSTAHRRFEEAGLLHHRIAECPLLKSGSQARRWDRASGWRTIAVPPKKGVAPDGAPG
jgi:hypothetical protein